MQRWDVLKGAPGTAVAVRARAAADRFAQPGLIPQQVAVADIVWKWTPST